uniref:Putative pectate lyase n=1 Tax=viral metagenome TaxID=1070528 RepID=A0A6H1ZCS4_9ZZZZ
MKKFLILILSIILFASVASAEFFSDVIVTSPNGIWTDSRAYTTLNAAVAAVDANDREIVIASPQVVTTLTVPANVRLKFLRNGSITNSGYLNIQTKNIEADNRQIFTGVGNIDFAAGTVVKTGWFSNIESAFALTTDDTVTLIVTKPQTITASYSPGNNVNLKWESPGNILTVNLGIVVGNLKNIEAGNYQIFAGAGDFDFLDGAELKLNWFNRLSDVLTWVESEKVTIVVNENSLVQATVASAANESIKVVPGGILNLDAGVVLTVNGDFSAGPYQAFTGAGTVVLSNVVDQYPEWYSSGIFTQATIESALTAIGTLNKATLILRPGIWVISSNADWSAYKNVTFKIVPGAVLQIATGTKTTISGPIEAGLYQVFDCIDAAGKHSMETGFDLATSGRVILRGGQIGPISPNWFGVYANVTQDDTAAFNLATGAVDFSDSIESVDANMTNLKRVVQVPAGNYFISGIVYVPSGVHLRGSGITSTLIYIDLAGTADSAIKLFATTAGPGGIGLPAELSEMVIWGYRVGHNNVDGTGGESRITNVRFQSAYGGILAGSDNVITGCLFDSCVYGITSASQNIIIANCLFYACNFGINVNIVTDNQIVNCHFEYSVFAGINITSSSNILISSCQFLLNVQQGTFIILNGAANSIEILNSTFRNSFNESVKDLATSGDINISNCVFNGLRTNPAYFQSTTAYAIYIGSSNFTVRNCSFLNLFVNPISLNSTGTVIISNCKYKLLNASNYFVYIPAATTGTVSISNCHGDNTIPLVNPPDSVSLYLSLSDNEAWLGALVTAGGRMGYTVPFQRANQWLCTVTATVLPSIGSFVHRKTTSFMVQKQVGWTGAALQTSISMVNLLEAPATGAIPVIDIDIDLTTIGGGLTSAGLFTSGTLIISVPDTYYDIQVSVHPVN